MSQDPVATNLAVVEGHFEAESTQDVEKGLELYTDDVVWEAPARGLHFEGKEAVAANYRAMFASIADVDLQKLQRFATEDRVVDDSIVTFTLTGDGYANLPVTLGSRVQVRLVHIFELRAGKISKETGFELWKVI